MRYLLGLLVAGSLAASDLLVAGALVGAGDQLLAQGKTSEAIRVFQAATELAPDSGFAWYRLARAYQAAGQGIERMVALRRARLADPQSLPIAMAWSEVLAGQGTSVRINTDCWGNGGPCAPGELGFVLQGRRF